VVAYGSTARSAARAVRKAREKGIAVSFVVPITIWPFPAEQVKELGSLTSDIVVPELNLGQIAHEVEWAVGRDARVHRLSRVDGELIRPHQILQKIVEVKRS
jgi:2-oxoglutarate ferredoxin oxidoreductase subunit alpha